MNKPIQICNKHGIPIGVVATPKTALEHGKIRLVSRVILTDPTGRILLQKRDPHMSAWPGRWDSSAAGHVDEGETPEAAAYREMYEEIGLEGIVLTYKRRYYNESFIQYGYVSKTYSYVYGATYAGDIVDLPLQKGEVSELAWFTPVEVLHLVRHNPQTATDGLIALFGTKQ